MSGSHPHKPASQPSDIRRDKVGQPETAPPDVPVAGFPEPPGKDPGDVSRRESPYSALNAPVGEPDPTAWPDRYDRRDDPRAPSEDMVFRGDGGSHTPVGATSDSEPSAAEDIEALNTDAPNRDNLDD